MGVLSIKRLVLIKPYTTVVDDVPIPEPGPGEALIQVKCVGVCGTDVRSWMGRHAFTTYPRIMGHEVSGVVVKLGDADAAGSGFSEGDVVVIEPYVACGKCYPCSLDATTVVRTFM